MHEINNMAPSIEGNTEEHALAVIPKTSAYGQTIPETKVRADPAPESVKQPYISISVPNYFHRKDGGSKLKNAKIRKAIKNLTGWENGSTHTLSGEFIPKLKIVVFKTNEEKTEVQSNV